MHSSYTKRRGVEKSLRMINTPSTTQLGQSKNLCHLLRSVSSHFTTSSPRAVNVHIQPTPPKRLFSPSHTALLVLQSSLQSENVTYCPQAEHGCVKLQSKQEYVRQIIYIYNIYICEKSTVQLTLVWGSLRLTDSMPSILSPFWR